MAEEPLPPRKLAKLNPSLAGSKKCDIDSEVDGRSVPSFATSPFMDGAAMLEPPSGESGRATCESFFSLLDWSLVLGASVSVGRIPVSIEPADSPEDCPPSQARPQDTKGANRIKRRTVEFTSTKPVRKQVLHRERGTSGRTHRSRPLLKHRISHRTH
jgi:hypothetical protein